jgi:hypothetical protein
MQQIFLLYILLLAQRVSGTIMPIIRSSRILYSWFPPVVFGAWFSSCRYGVELRVVFYPEVICFNIKSFCILHHRLSLILQHFEHYPHINSFNIRQLQFSPQTSNFYIKTPCVLPADHKNGYFLTRLSSY